MLLRGLYAITDNNLTPDHCLLDQVKQAILGGVKILQLRDKLRSDDELYPLAVALRELCREHKVLFIMNDRLALALKVDADGVHLGQHDLEFQEARKAIPDKLIGVSCYGDLERAEYYQDQGADYVAFGACFSSPTKPLAKQIPDTLLKEAKQRLQIPICAIGGITLGNAEQLTQHGVDMLAVISDLWQSPEIIRQAKAFSRLFEESPMISS